MPTSQRSYSPSAKPSCRPTIDPSSIPSQTPIGCLTPQSISLPSLQPIGQSFSCPSTSPSSQPTCQSSSDPIYQPNAQPFVRPAHLASIYPTGQPSIEPISTPLAQPLAFPSSQPSLKLNAFLSTIPSSFPPKQPFNRPSRQPSAQPSSQPNQSPIAIRTVTLTTNLLSVALGHTQNNTRNNTRSTSETLTLIDSLLYAVSASLLSNFNISQRSNTSGIVSSVTFVHELVKTSLSVISLPKVLPVYNYTNSTGDYRISVPIGILSSSSALSLELPPTSKTDEVGVLVSVVELSSFVVGAVNKSTSRASGYNSLASITNPIVTSNVLTISLVTVYNNLSVSKPILPTFEASLDVTNAVEPVAETVHLYHNCSIDIVDSATVYCRSSQVWLNVTCSGKAVATVKRLCPEFRHVCTVLNLADNNIASTEFCQTITTGSGSVLCRCGYDEAVTRNSSAMLSVLNGKVSVAALSAFSSSRLDASVIAVTRPISGDAASESVIVFAAFGSLWVIGVACIFASYSSIAFSKKKAVGSVPESRQAGRVMSYVSSVLPISLQMDRWWLGRVWETLCVKRKWWSIVRRLAGYRRLDFANESQERQQRRELLDIVYVITSLTLSCFISALFYDLQSHVDDGYCGQWTDQVSCQTTKTALDPQVFVDRPTRTIGSGNSASEFIY